MIRFFIRPTLRPILHAALGLCLAAGTAQAQEIDDNPSLDEIPHITMIGTAQAEAAPDIATLTIGMSTEKPTADAAAAETSKKAKALIDAAKAQGVAPTDIATQSLSLTQTFEEIRDAQNQVVGRRPRGFEAENIMAIRVRDLAKVGVIAGQLVENGANRLDGISFAVEHPDPLLGQLAGAAVKNARAQAQIATKAAGVHLGRVLLIARPRQDERARPTLAAVPMRAAALPVEAGTITFSREVEVTWALQ